MWYSGSGIEMEVIYYILTIYIYADIYIVHDQKDLFVYSILL